MGTFVSLLLNVALSLNSWDGPWAAVWLLLCLHATGFCSLLSMFLYLYVFLFLPVLHSLGLFGHFAWVHLISCLDQQFIKWKWKSLSRVRLFATPWTTQSMAFSRPEYWGGEPFPSPGDLPNPGMEPWSPALQVDSLPSEPQGKPKNTGVGSLSLIQGIFPTQELNRGLLHCRHILYQLSYQRSPEMQ